MYGKKLISLVLIFLFLLPANPSWGQLPLPFQQEKPEEKNLENQAQFYLQRITPTPAPSGELPAQRPRLPVERPAPSQVEAPRAMPRQLEEISAVERRAIDQLILIKQFGYSFFYQPPSSFLPVQAVPVGPDYVIGPGDTVKIIVWGSVQGEYNLTVDRNGQLDIPKIGVVHVSGLTYKQLREVMEREFARQFTNFQMNVTLDNLRSIQIFVVGQARYPGSYTISSLSTVINALFAAGGPSKSGSMRNIEVRRGGKVIIHFDMYDFLVRGDKRKDIRLQSEDVIFIPPIGPVAAIGSPKTPEAIAEELKLMARHELEEEQPGQLSWRGGEARKIIAAKEEPSPAGLKKPAINEMQPSELDAHFEKLFSMSFKEAAQTLAMSKKMEVGGPIKVSGIYELKDEKTLAGLIQLAGGLGDIAFKGRVQVLRVQGNKEMVLFDEDLEKVLSGRANIALVDGDFVEIFPVSKIVERKVRIAGAVKNPGEYGIREDMRVKDLIDYAGGMLLQADQQEAEITRVTITPQGPETTRINLSPRLATLGNAKNNIVLKPNDYLLIRTVPDWTINKTVMVAGEVKSPGQYAIKKGETLSSVLLRAGGFTDRAYPLGAVFTRVEVKETQKQQLKAAIDRLEGMVAAAAAKKATGGLEAEDARRAEVYARQQQQLLATLRKVEPLGRVVIRLDDPERLRGTPEDIELRESDYLYVPQVPQTINIVGAVFNPTGVVYTPYRKVGEYVAMAGGTSKIADDKEIYVIKVNGAAVSRKAFKWLGSSWDGTKYVYHMGGINSLVLDPGDTIVVPENVERIEWLREIKDIAIIIGQIALTAGVVLVGLK